MAGTLLGSNGGMGGGGPLSILNGASAPGQMASGFTSMLPTLIHSLVGGANPFANAATAATANPDPIPQVAGADNPQTAGQTPGGPMHNPFVTAAGPGSQGGWGAQPGADNFVSQDERSSAQDRFGTTADVNAAASNGQTVGPPVAATPQAPDAYYSIPPAIKAGIFKGEDTNGNYDTLFAHSDRPGGPFEKTRVSQMTVDQAIQFASPSGQYGQWVQQHNHGVLATPMGAYQVVGSTLARAKEGLGLSGSEQMTPQLQDKIGGWIFRHQGTGAWAGYKGPATPADPNAPGGHYNGPKSQPANGSYSTQTAMNQPRSFLDRLFQTDPQRFQRMMALARMGAPGPGMPNTQAPYGMPFQTAGGPVAPPAQPQHGRPLPAIDSMKALAAIGHSYRDQGYISNG